MRPEYSDTRYIVVRTEQVYGVRVRGVLRMSRTNSCANSLFESSSMPFPNLEGLGAEQEIRPHALVYQ